MGKLTSLPFQACKHHISSLDAQPSLSGGVLVFVTGQLLVRHAGCLMLPLLAARVCQAEGLLLLWIVAVADQAARQQLTPSVLCYHRCCVHSPTAAPVGTFQVAIFRPSLLKPQPCSVALQPEGETNPLKFSQTFHLAPVAGSFVVTNDLFRCAPLPHCRLSQGPCLV